MLSIAEIVRRVDMVATPVCLHLHSQDLFFHIDSLVQRYRELGVDARGVHALTVRPRRLDSIIPDKSVNWFVRYSSCSRIEARKIISDLPENIHPRLSYNAGTPCCLLAIAAEYFQKPELLIYSTSGLDPAGVKTVNAYVNSVCVGLRSVHLNFCNINERQWDCYSMDPVQCIDLTKFGCITSTCTGV